MIRPLVAVLLLSSAPMVAEAQDRDWGPLTHGYEGLLQCYEPDAEAHSCRSLAAYAWGDGEEIDNLGEVLMSRDPWIVMRVTTPVTLQGDAICGPYRKEDLEAATFEVRWRARRRCDLGAAAGRLHRRHAVARRGHGLHPLSAGRGRGPPGHRGQHRRQAGAGIS